MLVPLYINYAYMLVKLQISYNFYLAVGGVMENLHVVAFFFMNLGFVYYSVYV
jgi:hypothetical protein